MLMVAQVQSNWTLILRELARWKELSRGQSLVDYSTSLHYNLIYLVVNSCKCIMHTLSYTIGHIKIIDVAFVYSGKIIMLCRAKYHFTRLYFYKNVYLSNIGLSIG